MRAVGDECFCDNPILRLLPVLRYTNVFLIEIANFVATHLTDWPNHAKISLFLNQIRSFLPHLLKKSLMKSFIFCAVPFKYLWWNILLKLTFRHKCMKASSLHLWIMWTDVVLCEKCPNVEFYLVCIFPHLDWISRDTRYLSVFSPNRQKYRLEKTPYLDTFHAVYACQKSMINQQAIL